jgi:hypothetical protein
MGEKINAVLLTLACVLLAVVETGCGSKPQDSKKIRCARESALPISIATVRASLMNNGYKVTLRPDRCNVEDIAMQLNAIPRTDANALVICDVRVRPIYGRGFHRLATGDWVQDNVQCGIYPGSKEKASTEIERLKITVRSMAK